MISVIAPVGVAVAFALAIISVWVVKPGSKLWRLKDTGYDKNRPPSEKEWRKSQIHYTILLVFLGILFISLTWISLSF
jgi:NADH:ubiquinone oxidoreductase subunit 3 (subunit A)